MEQVFIQQHTLVGIMSNYEKSNCKEDFEDYYIVCRREEKYHYRNVRVVSYIMKYLVIES